MTRNKLKLAIPAATHTGKVTLNFAKVVPNPGPSKKPNPKATPINPKVFALVSGVDISANTAVAVAAVPPLMPSIVLAKKRRKRGSEFAHKGKIVFQLRLTVNANKVNPITEPDTHILMIGFLPYLSLKAPIRGDTANCAIAYVPAKKPRVLPLLLNLSNKKGNKGKTILSPSLSFNKVINALKSVFLLRLLVGVEFKFYYY